MYMQNNEVKSKLECMHVSRVHTWMALRSYVVIIDTCIIHEYSLTLSQYTVLQYRFDLSLPSACI